MNPFEENRKKLQELMLKNGFITPIYTNDLPWKIQESKNQGKANKLTFVFLDNIPTHQKPEVRAIEIDLEIEQSPFSKPETFKTVEKAIVFFTRKSLYVLLIEMKSELKANELGNIKQKIEDSLNRVILTLSHYDFIIENIENLKMRYKTLICFNRESIEKDTQNNLRLKEESLYKIFVKEEEVLNLNDMFGNKHRIEVHFCQNKDNSTNMTINLNDIFQTGDFKNWEKRLDLIFPF